MEESINLMCDKDCTVCILFDECQASLKLMVPELIMEECILINKTEG